MPPKMILESEELDDCIKSMTNTEKVFWYAEAVMAQKKHQWRKENISSSTPPTPNRPRIIRKVIVSRAAKRGRPEMYFPTPSIESLNRRYQPIAPAPPKYSPLSSPRSDIRVVKSATSSPGVHPLRHLQMIRKISQSSRGRDDGQEENEAGKQRDADTVLASED